MADCRAVLVSEKRLLRDGLKEMLQKSRISVIGEAPNIPDLIVAMETQPGPELVICHITCDQSPEAARELVYGLRERFALAKLVVLADSCTRPLLSSFIGADVNAILLTSISSEMLQRSLELVLVDHRLFPAEIMSLIMDSAMARLPVYSAPVGRPIIAGTSPLSGRVHDDETALPAIMPSEAQAKVALSKREHQILDCLVCGLPNKSIARELNITEATVKVYVKGLLRKIKVSNRTQVAIWALQQSHPLGTDQAVASIETLSPPVELHSQPATPASFAD
jgi:two-component system, NarL family, nitrate/nitrite response regulator NarL